MNKEWAEKPFEIREAFAKSSERGMTLVEIMVVVVIISMVTGIAGVAVFNALAKAQIESTRTQMASISDALDIYRLNKKKYPGTAEGLGALVATGEMKNVPKDPWDNDFIYIASGATNFTLSSSGPDGISGSEDDITHGQVAGTP